MRNLRLALLALSFAAGAAHAEAPKIVTSIAPIHSLTAQVMAGVGEPELLVPASVSGHDYALTPSDLEMIAGADLVIWIGEPFETDLIKAIEMERVADLQLLHVRGVEPRRFDAEEAQQHGKAAGHDNHAHDGLALDPHIWLDPVRAVPMLVAISDMLSDLDPDHARQYRANSQVATAKLEALNLLIGERLKPLADRPFVTFHDGYWYFVNRYGLNQVGEIAVHPEQRPGAASLRALQETIAEEGVVCAFTEPQFDGAIVKTLAGDTDIKVGELDPLGAGLTPGPDLYAALLEANTDAIARCLLPSD